MHLWHSQGTGRPGAPMYRSMRSFARDAAHNRLLMIPAALYAVNNYLKFVMQLYFKPTTAKMLGNLKVCALSVICDLVNLLLDYDIAIPHPFYPRTFVWWKWSWCYFCGVALQIFTIALLLRAVLNRKFSTIQWEALFLLVFGITINQLSACKSGSSTDHISSAAMLYTLGSVTIPATASVYNELALKKHMKTSVHLQVIIVYQICSFGTCDGYGVEKIAVISLGMLTSCMSSIGYQRNISWLLRPD